MSTNPTPEQVAAARECAERIATAVISTEELILLLRSIPVDYYDKEWDAEGTEMVRIPYGQLAHLAASHLEKFIQTAQCAKGASSE